MEYIMKIVFWRFWLVDKKTLLKQMKWKEKMGRFLGMLLNALDASLLGNIIAGKGVIRASDGVVQP